MPTLDWIGKKAVINHHQDVPYRLIHCDSRLSAGDPDAGNLLVEGDNLDALKALLPYYAGKVKCIYIDPPYNTGSEEWIYNDNVNSPQIVKWLGEAVGKEAEDLSRHDKWLCMMYPRLRLLREFLTDDGVLLCSIDDNEAIYTRILLNDIFGTRNFVAQLVWEKGRKNDAKLFSVGHDYIFAFARNVAALESVVWRSPKEGVVEIATEYHRLKNEYGNEFESMSKALSEFYARLPKGHPSKKYSRARNADERGVWRDNNISWHGGGGPKYDIIHPVTGRACKVPDDGWRFVEETMKQKIADGYVIFREDHTKPPIYKSYIYMEKGLPSENTEYEGQSEVLGSVFYRHTQPSNDVMKSIFGEKVFPNPKDHEILARLIRYVTSGSKNCIILDSFAGSGSTGHAVLELNHADGGSRRFVLVEVDKKTASEITSIRLARVIDELEKNASPAVTSQCSGFRYCSLGEPLFDADGGISPSVTFPDLAAHVFFAETGQPIPKKAQVGNPFLGAFQNRAVYLLWSREGASKPGAHKDNMLTIETLAALPPPTADFSGERVVYADGCTVSPERLARDKILFKQVPYRVAGN